MEWLGLRISNELPEGQVRLLDCTHNGWLVLLAFLVASAAAYTALSMGERVANVADPAARRRWYWIGALCLGGGIWSMHFIAMLAFEAPVVLHYDALVTALSLLVVIGVSLATMRTLGRPQLGPRHYLAGSLTLGLGIACMHYTGMAAIRSEATQTYRPELFMLSIDVAVVTSLVALMLAVFFRGRDDSLNHRLRIPASLVMGGAIVSMHFTGMWALELTVSPGTELHLQPPAQNLAMAVSVGLIAFLSLFFGLGAAWADRQLQRRDQDLERVGSLLKQLDQAKAVLQKVAHVDPLTSLPNRRAFNEVFAERLAIHGRTRQSLAVMFLDIDHFKRINDSLGHDAGDALLKSVAERIAAMLRDEDLIARLGGDEFCILAGLHRPEEARVLAQRVMQALKEPIELAGRKMVMTTSIGISLFPEDGESCEELLKHADLALYQSKGSGRNNLHFFSRHLKHKATVELQLEEELRRALAEDRELELHYQPILALAGNRLGKLEALVRWRHPQHGLLTPDRFVGIAEANGFITELDAWVLRRACRELAELGHDGLRVAVNCSALNLCQDELADRVAEALALSGLAANRLELEVTENALMSNVNQALRLLQRIRDQGVAVSIDDFGTGYSSLAYLKRLPLDTLKIDRCFIQDLPHAHADMEIVQAIIGMAHTLRLQVVAEGVESEAQLELLRGLGCDFIQGYLLSRPRLLADLRPLLEEWGEGPALNFA